MVKGMRCLKGDRAMIKAIAAVFMVVSFLFAAPVLESATSGSTQIFQAIGTADGGDGGGE
jgi:hypothetical protein